MKVVTKMSKMNRTTNTVDEKWSHGIRTRVNIKLYHYFKFVKISAGGGAMTRGNQLLSGKGLTANEAAFTERNEATDAPRNFREAEMEIGMMKEMVDNGILRILMEDAMSAVPGFKPITFQGKFNNIYRTNQPAESSYLNTRSLLEFNRVIPHGLHTVPADF